MNTFQNNFMYPNVLPAQQILQANGRASVNAMRMSPNSSALVADTNLPVVYKCTSDSLGNVTVEAFDISPHKDAMEIGEVAAAKKICCLIEAVDCELKWAQRRHINLLTADYDIGYILGEQQYLHDYYKDMMHDKH